MTQIDDTQNKKTTGTYTWRQSRPAEMIGWIDDSLAVTPRWKILKRIELNRRKKYWEKQV